MSNRVNVACIGVGMMGISNMLAAETAGAGITAICDVDDTRAKEAGGNFPDATLYTDYRRLLEMEKSIDAVIVSTPNHTHAVISMAAIKLGKHVYCEKPLAHTVHEIRRLTEAAREYKVATQLGNQGHAYPTIREISECIRSGAIGAVREVHLVEAAFSFSLVDRMKTLSKNYPVPENLNWDLWLGPARYREYNPLFHPLRWRSVRQFSTGMIGDFFCHLADPIFSALNLGAPASIIAEVKGYDEAKCKETFPRSSKIRLEFPAHGERPALTMYWYDGDKFFPPRPEELNKKETFIPDLGRGPVGALVIGDTGKMIYASHGGADWRLIPDSLMSEYMKGRTKVWDPRNTKRFGAQPNNLDNLRDWLEACKGGDPAGSNFDYGGPLTEAATLGDIAQQMPGIELEWDADNMRFTNRPEANEYLHYQYRNGWSL